MSTCTITALHTTAFRAFGEESLVVCFSHCAVQDLGRLAGVSLIIKRISEDNLINVFMKKNGEN